MDMNLIYKSNSDHLQAEEIGQQMWIVTIQKIEIKEFEEGKQKLVLSFAETSKTLPLNVTNARAISELYGPDTDQWMLRQIMLFTMMVDFAGKAVLGIRIRAPQQQQPVQPAGFASSLPAQVPPQQIFTQPGSQPRPGAPQQPPAGGYDERNPPPADPNAYGPGR